MDGALTVGALVAFQSLMQRFSAPIEGLVQLGGNLQTVKGDLARIDDVMNYRTEERLDDSAKVTGGDKLATGRKLLGKVEIKDLVFGYNRTDPPLIDHRSEEHTSELQSLMRISYAVFCLKKKK